MADPTTNENGSGPWWAKLGTVGIAMAGLVYLGESLGGRFLQILANDLAAERKSQISIIRALERQAVAGEHVQRQNTERLEIDRERNRILERMREDLHEQSRPSN